MRAAEPFRYGLWSGAAALSALAAPLVAALVREPAVVPWLLFGWIIGAAPGLLGGTKLLGLHGVAGAGFLKVMGACMLARLIVFPAGALIAFASGKPAVVAYGVGIFAGYLPTQIAEGAWFLRRSRATVPHRPGVGAEPGWSDRG